MGKTGSMKLKVTSHKSHVTGPRAQGPGRRLLVSFLLCLVTCVLCLFSTSAKAENINFESSVSASKIGLGQSIQLLLTVTGAQDVSAIDLNSIEGFTVRYLGPSTRVSIVNGQYSSSKSFIYSIFPTKVGKFTIPSFTINIQGKDYSTKPIEVEVVDNPVSPAEPGSPQEDAQSLKDRLYITFQLGKNEAYLNEKLPITIKMYVNDLSVRDVEFPSIDHVGFSIEDFSSPTQYSEMQNGRRYQVVEFKTTASPTRTGNLTLGPVRLNCSLLVKNSQDRSLGQGMYDEDFFNGFFSSYERHPVVVSTPHIEVRVLDLPKEGQPKDFSGAVGQFEFNASVSPQQVKVGDPITLKMIVKGSGNLKAVAMPEFIDTRFKIYEPQVKEEGGKLLEQVIIPVSSEIKEIPALTFSYFDPASRQYQTLVQGPFSIQVEAAANQPEFKAIEFAQSNASAINEALGQDIIFIKDKPGSFIPAGFLLIRSFVFWLLFVIYGCVWAGCFIYYRLHTRLKIDEQFARRLKAPREAKKGLAQAKQYLASGQAKEFYDQIFKTLREYLGNKLHVSSAGMTFAEAGSKLKERQAPEEVLSRIRHVFEVCDMVRYASARLSEQDMGAVFKDIEQIIDYLERHIR